jgi:hypothetical protein
MVYGAAALAAGTFWPATNVQSSAELTGPVLRVEEDWKLILNEPNGNVDSPQFHTIMSPFGDMNALYAQVLWNYRETPGFTPGGVQLQSYQGEQQIQRRSVEYRKLSNTAETITWTQALSTNGSVVTFEITNGLSTTWGTFGRDMRLDENANLTDLSSYNPQVSEENTRVTFGSNRVDAMLITQIRWYGPNGLIGVDSTPRVVYQFGDDQ